MKYAFTFLIALAIGQIGFAQIIVTSDIYPEVGDTLRSITTINPDTSLRVSPEGPDQIWVYDTLNNGPTNRTVFISVEATDTTVDGAVNASELPTGGFVYYGETEDFYGLMAFDQEVSLPGLPDIFARYGSPLPDYYASLEYEDSYNNSTRLISSAFGGDIIPQEIIDSLGLPLTPDSLRVEQDYTRISTVDAWGTLTTPTGTFDVIRERRENQTANFVGLKAGFLPWFALPIGPASTAVQYVYWNDEQNEPILVQNIDSIGRITTVQYYTEQRLTSTSEVSDLTMTSAVYPNPTIDKEITLTLPSDGAGMYHLSWYEVDGTRIATEERDLSAAGQKLSIPNTSATVLYLMGRSVGGQYVFQHRIMITR